MCKVNTWCVACHTFTVKGMKNKTITLWCFWCHFRWDCYW